MNVKQYKSAVQSLGCLVCGDEAELHHPLAEKGLSQRASDWVVIPLCPLHHRQGTTMAAPSVHGSPRLFYSKFQLTEIEMLAEVNRRLNRA